MLCKFDHQTVLISHKQPRDVTAEANKRNQRHVNDSPTYPPQKNPLLCRMLLLKCSQCIHEHSLQSLEINIPVLLKLYHLNISDRCVSLWGTYMNLKLFAAIESVCNYVACRDCFFAFSLQSCIFMMNIFVSIFFLPPYDNH